MAAFTEPRSVEKLADIASWRRGDPRVGLPASEVRWLAKEALRAERLRTVLDLTLQALDRAEQAIRVMGLVQPGASELADTLSRTHDHARERLEPKTPGMPGQAYPIVGGSAAMDGEF